MGESENGFADGPGNNSFCKSSAKSNYFSPSLAIAVSTPRPNQTGSHVPGALALILLYLITFLRLQWLSFNKTQLTRCAKACDFERAQASWFWKDIRIPTNDRENTQSKDSDFWFSELHSAM